jgi:hypothetical protein
MPAAVSSKASLSTPRTPPTARNGVKRYAHKNLAIQIASALRTKQPRIAVPRLVPAADPE